MKRPILLATILTVLFTGACGPMSKLDSNLAERARISRVIHDSIGWALNKDKKLLFDCFAHDAELFWFSPRDDGTIRGFDAFASMTESFFMSDDFKAVRFEVRELEINLSRSGDVAWYHARLDDFNEWKGQAANWEDVRWTGVLEKREGHWRIVQMHFSDASG